MLENHASFVHRLSVSSLSGGMPSSQLEDRPSELRVWLLAIRPNTLTASLSPILVGAAAAWRLGFRDLALAAQWWGFAVFCQIGVNLHNDYADFVKGADTEKRVGQARATQKGWLTPTQVSTAAMAAVLVQIAIGLNLTCGQEVGSFSFVYMLFVTFSSAFNAFAYTGGEYPLGYIGLGWVSIGYSGLGDVFVFLYFGIVSTVTPYVLQAHELPPPVLLWISAAVGCLATSIIVVNNLRDRHEDVRAGKRTLAVRFGGLFARIEYTILVLIPYIFLAFAAASVPDTRITSLQPWLALLPTFFNIRSIWTHEGGSLNPYVGKSALSELLFCVHLSALLVLAR